MFVCVVCCWSYNYTKVVTALNSCIIVIWLVTPFYLFQTTPPKPLYIDSNRFNANLTECLKCVQPERTTFYYMLFY